VHRIRRIYRHTVESDEHHTPDSISDTEDGLNWIGHSDNPNDSEDDWVVDVETDIDADDNIEGPQCPEQWDVSTTPNVAGLIRRTRKSKRQAEEVVVMVNEKETRRNNAAKKK